MANITIPIADANIAEIRDALCDYGGRQAGSPITKAEFATGVLKGIARDILRDYRKAAAAKASAPVPDVDAL